MMSLITDQVTAHRWNLPFFHLVVATLQSCTEFECHMDIFPYVTSAQQQQLGLNARYLPLIWPVRQSGAPLEHNDVILYLGLHTTALAASILFLSVFLPCLCYNDYICVNIFTQKSCFHYKEWICSV